MTHAHDTSAKNPSWWNDTHSSGWERTKEALQRDWEQTKADFTDGGQELNQGADDTVKQAVGKQAIPSAGVPNRDDVPADSTSRRNDWSRMEPAVRYGYGARQHYGDSDWNDDLEGKLRQDWDSSGSQGTWDQMKNAVKRGWQSVKRAV